MRQSRIYKTYINIDGSYAHMDVLFINEQEAQKFLNRSLKTCEEYLGVSYKVSYTVEALYYSKEYQKNIVYHIANANSISTYTQFNNCLKEFYPEYYGKVNRNIIIEELNLMASSSIPFEGRVYPNMKRIIQHKVK